MFKSIAEFFHKFRKSEKEESKSTAKERLHLVLAQDRANISADFLEMMKQEILEVIKKYIDIDEKARDVRLTNKESEDGKVGAPALYANIPIITIKNEARKLEGSLKKKKEENNINKTELQKEQKVKNKPEYEKQEKDNLRTTETNIKQDDKSEKTKNEEESKDSKNNIEEVKNEKKNS